MKRVAALVALSLVVVTVATAPAASAQSICKETGVASGLVDVLAHKDCTVEVVFMSGLNCLWGTASKTYTVGPVSVTYWYCTNPNESPKAGIACPEKRVRVGVQHEVWLHPDCTADIVVNRGIICVGPWVGRIEQTVGPVHVLAYYCSPPGGLPVTH